MSAIVYLRMSQDRTGEELGIIRQREDCLHLAAIRGWQVAQIIKDDKSAAGKKTRPGFEELLKLVDQDQVRVVVAWNLDRLTRNRRDTVRLIEACERHQVTIALVRGSDMDLATPAGRLAADILAGVARHEIDQKSDRQRRAVQQAVDAGKRVGGRRPFGYGVDTGKRKMVKGREVIVWDVSQINEPEAAAVRWAYAALLSGTSLGAIAREWNRRGLHTPQGTRSGTPRPWVGQTVSLALRKATYAGIRTHNGVERGPAAWKGLVDEATWRAAQDVLRDPSRKRQGGPRALLTGIAVCGVDGCGLTVHSGGGKTSARNYRSYRCRSMRHINRRADPIDALIAGGEIADGWVDGLVVERLRRDDARNLLARQSRPDVGQLHAEAEQLRRRLEVLAGDLDMDEQTLARRDRAIRTRLGEIASQLADAGRADILGPLITAEDVAAAWVGYDLDRRRLVVNTLMAVTILPVTRGTRTFRTDSVRVVWRGDVGEG